MPKTSQTEPLLTLRQYGDIAPWNLKDLVQVAGAMLVSCAIRPTNAAAADHPTERTVRFYISRGLLPAPEGKGTAATYSYRHLLQLLAVKLRQMEGATLDLITGEMARLTGDVIERRVASALGPGLPPPRVLLVGDDEPNRGRLGRAAHSWDAAAENDSPDDSTKFSMAKWYRIPVSLGLELHVHEGHPLAKRIGQTDEISSAIRASVNRLVTE